MSAKRNWTNDPKSTEDIYLFGEITDGRAEFIVEQIDRSRMRGDRVRFWICSLGGDLGGALAIHDALQRAKGSEAIATGNCQSAALVAFLGAETRWATPNTIFMNHDVTADLGHHLPDDLGLPALEWLKGLPKGTFGPAQARELGIIATFAEIPVAGAEGDA